METEVHAARKSIGALPGDLAGNTTDLWQIMSDRTTAIAALCLIDNDSGRAKSLRGDCRILDQTVQAALVRRTGS